MTHKDFHTEWEGNTVRRSSSQHMGLGKKSSKCMCVLSERETWSQSFFNVYVITSPVQILSQNIQCLYPLAPVTPILFILFIFY